LRRSNDEVADTALFLASEQAGYVTGENVVVDGGLTSGLSTAFVNQIYQADQEPTGKPHTESGTEA
jgi:3-oxoacyl-[acyl-carrier protein] reductase